MEKKGAGDWISAVSCVPLDAAAGETVLLFMGRQKMRIENYRGILLFSDTCIRIQARRYVLRLSGKRLQIPWYDRDEMTVTGLIEEISFE